MNNEDYKRIIEKIDVEEVKKLLKRLGARDIIETEKYLITNTICHNDRVGKASMKLYFYKDTKLFVCYTECGNMSIFKFLKHYYETRKIKYDWFQDILEVVLNISSFSLADTDSMAYHVLREEYYERKNRKELEIFPTGILDMFVKNYTVEWLSDGITKEAMDKFYIRYSISQNKIVIPHFNVNNQLIGIRGRALNKWEEENIGKYMPLQIEKKWYSHSLSLNLYGLNKTISKIRQNGYCYIFEAEKSVLQLESFDNTDNCAVASCGSNINKYQIDLLMRTCHPKEIIICFDKEEKKGETKYFDKLFAICKKYNHYADFSFIYDRTGLLKLKDSPSDNGEKTFKELIRRRVKVK